MMAKREIPTQREKHYLRFKLRAVTAAAVQEFEVDITINTLL